MARYQDKSDPSFVSTLASDGASPIKMLPDRVFSIAFSYLSLEELGQVASVCTSFRRLVDSDMRWRLLALSENVKEVIDVYNDPERLNWHVTFNKARVVSKNWLSMTSDYVTKTLKGHKSDVFCMATSPHLLFTGSSDRTIRIYSTDTLALMGTLKGHTGGVWALQYDPLQDLLVSGDTNGVVKLWRPETGEHVCDIDAHPAAVSCLQLDGSTLITGSFDNTLCVWDLNRRTRKQALGGGHYGLHRFHIWSCSLAPSSNTLVSGSWDCKIKVWDLTSNECAANLTGHTGPVRSVAYDGFKIVSGSFDHTIKTWDLALTKDSYNLHTLTGHSGPVSGVAIDRKKIVSSSYDGTVKIWDLDAEPPSCVRTLAEHDDAVMCLALDWRRVYSGSKDKKTKVCDFAARTTNY